jgi:hypothetical protein
MKLRCPLLPQNENENLRLLSQNTILAFTWGYADFTMLLSREWSFAFIS